MNAKHIISLYESGQRDFRSINNLRGVNFKGANLSGADFSGCDIHGANFRGANLKNTNFTKAKGGLQKRWAIGLLLVSLFAIMLTSFANPMLSAFIIRILEPGGLFTSGNPTVDMTVGLLCLSFYLTTVFLAWHTSLILAIGIAAILFVIAIIVSVTGIIATAGAGAVAVAVVIIAAGIGAITVPGAIAVSGESAIIIAILSSISGVVTILKIAVISELIAIVGLISGAVAGVVFWTWIGWRAWQGDPRDAWVRSFAVAYGAMGGTCFRGADLTNANFTSARLKSTDFREAKLVRTIFEDAIKLDQVRPGSSYLGIKKIRELLLTKKANPNESYNNLVNLRGLNLANANLVGADFSDSNLSNSDLSGANLTDANLITTNLNDADLKDADLSRAKLVQTQLDNADFTGVTLTGACIEDWGITVNTILNGIHADYVYMRFLDGDKRRRKPDGEDINFAEGEFVEFIKPLIDTLDLYHRQVTDPRTVALALRELQDKHPDANIDPISWERRGKNGEDVLVRAQISEKANPSQLHAVHFEEYERLQTLPSSEIAALMAEVKAQKETINMLQGFVGDALSRPITIQQDNTMTQQDGSKYDMSGSTFGIGVNEGEIGGNAIIAGQYNAAPKPELTELGKEIGDRLTRLEQQYGDQTLQGKMAVTTQFMNEIQAEPLLAKRILSALEKGGIAALQAYFIGPSASFVVAAVNDWQKTAQPRQINPDK